MASITYIIYRGDYGKYETHISENWAGSTYKIKVSVWVKWASICQQYLISYIMTYSGDYGTYAGWWFGTWFFPYIENVIIPTDFHIFQKGWNHQPVCVNIHFGAETLASLQWLNSRRGRWGEMCVKISVKLWNNFLVGGLEHVLFSTIYGIILPID